MVSETQNASKDLDLLPACACAATNECLLTRSFDFRCVEEKNDYNKISIIFVVFVITCSSASDLISEDHACRFSSCFILWALDWTLFVT